MSRNSDYPKYVTNAEKIARAAKDMKKLAHTRDLHPIQTNTRSIASTWWGKSWIKNLEGYADYSSRLPRGRSYVRTGAVIDLCIENGRISALVSGSGRRPYEVCITISPLVKRTHERLVEKCRSSLQGLHSLLSGDFPADLKKSFLARGDGLFPAPREISFDCTCPDWASMCKHVAAVLYGTAVRLDENPELFFTLRGIQITDFVDSVIKEETRDFTTKAPSGSGRILSRKDSRRLFGI